MNSLQILAIIFGLLYIIYAAKNELICFVFGAISSSFWAYESFYNLNLKFDGILQAFYVLMSIYGAYNWHKGNENPSSDINTLSLKENVLYVVLGLLVSYLSARIALQFFELNFAYLDAITTGFSIIATYLLAKRYFENWIYWMVINPIYIYIYIKSGATSFAAMSVLYFAMSIVGYVNWKNEMSLSKLD